MHDAKKWGSWTQSRRPMIDGDTVPSMIHRTLLAVLLAILSLLVAVNPGHAQNPPGTPVSTAPADFLLYAYLHPAAPGAGLTPKSLAPISGLLQALPALAQHAAAESDPDRLAALRFAASAAAAGRPVSLWLIGVPTSGTRTRDWLIAIGGLSAATTLAKAELPNAIAEPPTGAIHARRMESQDLLLLGSDPALALWTDAAAKSASVAAAEWPAHRAKAAHERPAAPVVFELAVNLNSIRQHAASAFEAERAAAEIGVGTQVLGALRWSNARTVGLHLRLLKPDQVATRDPSLPRAPDAVDAPYKGPPLLIADITWSARSEPPGTVRKLALSTGHWPAMQLGEPPAATVVACIRPALKGLIFRAIDFATAVSTADERPAFVSARQRWALECAGSSGPLDRVCNGLDPWTTVSILHTDQSPASATTLRLRTKPRPGASAETITKSFGQLFASQPALAEKKGPDATPTWTATPAPRWCISAIRWGFVPDQSAFEAEFDLGTSPTSP